jgi:methionyl-tRNA formyltransferase
MGTPEISSIYLQSLIDNQYNIVGVYSQPPRKKGRGMFMQESATHNLAIKKGIKVFTPLDFSEETVLKILKNLEPDLIIVMGYGLKLPNKVLNLPRLGCINIHVSLLPRWRGAAPIEYALLNGDKVTGVTIFKLVEEMDAGPILLSNSIDIDKDINKEELTKNLNFIGINLLNKILPKIFKQEINLREQSSSLVTYAKKISTDLRKINFYDSGENIYNKVRAFSSKPSAWFHYNNEIIKIIKSDFVKGSWDTSTIINDKFQIGCSDGKICPKIIQREGKKPMHLNEFLRGFQFIVGSKINV